MKRPRTPSPAEVERRLREASRLGALSPDRLSAKIDLSPSAVRGRLREASDLLDACRALAALRPRTDEAI